MNGTSEMPVEEAAIRQSPTGMQMRAPNLSMSCPQNGAAAAAMKVPTIQYVEKLVRETPPASNASYIRGTVMLNSSCAPSPCASPTQIVQNRMK